MEALNTPFEVDSKHRILVCTRCRYAVRPKHVNRHLKDQHKGISLQQRRDLVTEVATCTELAQVQSDVVYPTARDPPVDALPVYFDGLRCNWTDEQNNICGYICRTPRQIRQHCTQKHGWINQQKRGSNARLKQVHATNSIWTSNYACQQFFKEGG